MEIEFTLNPNSTVIDFLTQKINEETTEFGDAHTLMERVHDYGRECGCTIATLGTMSFQSAQQFYERLGYVSDYKRTGYINGSSCVFMKKIL